MIQFLAKRHWGLAEFAVREQQQFTHQSPVDNKITSLKRALILVGLLFSIMNDPVGI